MSRIAFLSRKHLETYVNLSAQNLNRTGSSIHIWLCLLQKLYRWFNAAFPFRPYLMTDSTFSYSDFILPAKSAKKRKNKNFITPLSTSHSLDQLRAQIRQEEWFTQCSRQSSMPGPAQNKTFFLIPPPLSLFFSIYNLKI